MEGLDEAAADKLDEAFQSTLGSSARRSRS